MIYFTLLTTIYYSIMLEMIVFHMLIGAIELTTYAISAYHHWRCEFQNPIQARCSRYIIMWWILWCDLRQVGSFLWVLRFPPPI